MNLSQLAEKANKALAEVAAKQIKPEDVTVLVDAVDDGVLDTADLVIELDDDIATAVVHTT